MSDLSVCLRCFSDATDLAGVFARRRTHCRIVIAALRGRGDTFRWVMHAGNVPLGVFIEAGP